MYKKLVEQLGNYSKRYRSGETLGRAIQYTEDLLDEASAAIETLETLLQIITPESIVKHGYPVYHNRPTRYEHYEMVHETDSGEPLYKRQYYKLQDNPVGYCSECGKRLCSRFINFCPNCGAKMDLEARKDEI